MSEPLRQLLRESVDQVLEKMFFIEPMGEISVPEGDALPGDVISVRVPFQGEPSGCLRLRLTRNAARPIAADFLAADEGDVSDVQMSDVVCELTNMICGSVLSRADSATSFHLAAPQMVTEWDDSGANYSTRYAVEIPRGWLAVDLATGTA